MLKESFDVLYGFRLSQEKEIKSKRKKKKVNAWQFYTSNKPKIFKLAEIFTKNLLLVHLFSWLKMKSYFLTKKKKVTLLWSKEIRGKRIWKSIQQNCRRNNQKILDWKVRKEPARHFTWQIYSFIKITRGSSQKKMSQFFLFKKYS